MIISNSEENRPVIIVGMHRSGTSLLASMLESAGLFLGNHLMTGKANNNAKGFFENLDFVKFHESVLESLGFMKAGWLTKQINVPHDFVQRAKSIVESNSSSPYWGWKDPRTTLFLDFWSEMLPGAVFICIFRNPWDVVDSLFRRGDNYFLDSRSDQALQVWSHYNREILRFYRENPEIVKVISLASLVENPDACLGEIAETFALKLGPVQRDILEKKLLTISNNSSAKALIIKEHFYEIYSQYSELEDIAASVSRITANLVEEKNTEVSREGIFILDQWRRIATLERELRQVNETLYDTRSELYHAKQELATIKRSRVWKLRNLVRSVGVNG